MRDHYGYGRDVRCIFRDIIDNTVSVQQFIMSRQKPVSQVTGLCLERVTQGNDTGFCIARLFKSTKGYEVVVFTEFK